ncbi:hypothetical protein [Neoroseomonas oryzicola]|uniref:Uncharacterized protein n=1 Tax=Neoroseomonas oryzicola TaxID=535904 RepID=A0A9X9WDV2_9PROT|nr:hypothetical protein [Neoroseomonas oryzicola]MBR0658512.1 hypothetical protein [Neoroseomonas oryzicola]NKE20286.1 hypothetical protein [Neoroseomonas oryzicola]
MYIRYRVMLLVAALVAGAAVVNLLTGDVDAFEERTGLFAFLGTLIIDGIVLLAGVLAAIYAASVFFPRRWGEKAGPVGAIVAALVAAFCFRVLWLGGA